MKSLICLAATIAFVISAPARAQVARLDDSAYLRKLSLHIRGTPPMPTEYAELKTAQAQGQAAIDKFFDQRIASYLGSTGHQTKMVVRLEELFKLKTSARAVGEPVPDDYRAIDTYSNALDYMFLSMARDNLSWDQLLTGKSYRLFSSTAKFGGLSFPDFGFMRAVFPNVIPAPTDDKFGKPKPLTTVDVSFDPTDVRAAGALTTSRFFGRYTTTELNKNRRRAAAVFNIFMCDPMAAAIPDPPTSPDADLDRAFPGTSTITTADLDAIAKMSDKHGADQACVKCHYKLDPMGEAFMTSTATLSPLASAGRLTYRDQKDDHLVNTPVAGLGELGAEITKQDQYVRCQVRHFWNWFIGEDRDLSDARTQELETEFNRVGRRTNDFIRSLVTSPEFRTRDFRTPTEIRATSVRTVLKNCVDCHSAKIPDFTVWPIGGTSVTMKDWIGRISTQMDLAHGGAARKMPPAWSAWTPTAADVALLKAWIDDGAPNEKGDRQL